MKNKIILAWLFCLLSLNITAKNKPDSIHASEPSRTLLVNIVQPQKVSLQLTDSLSNEYAKLKERYQDLQREIIQKEDQIDELNKQIDSLQNVTIKRLESKNDTLQLKLISMASNFLYIPYEAYSIDEIAIPAFKATNGSKAYYKYQNRLSLLINYKADVQSLIEYLTKAEKDLSIDLTKYRNDKAVEHLNILEELPLYTRYSSYNDWKNTYLGKRIKEIQKQLKTPSEQTKNKLEDIRIKLGNLLKN